MKNYFFLGAIVTLLGMVMTGCQDPDPQPVVPVDNTVYSVSYSIDGTVYQTVLQGGAALDSLIVQLIHRSREGSEVIVYSDPQTIPPVASKETFSYSTANEAEAARWTAQKVKEGYKVYVSYNETTGIYTCLAFLNYHADIRNCLPGTVWYRQRVGTYDYMNVHFTWKDDIYIHFLTDSTGEVHNLMIEYNGEPVDPPEENIMVFNYTHDSTLRCGFITSYNKYGREIKSAYDYDLIQKRLRAFDTNHANNAAVFHLIEN